jgi:hypothetical protein
VLFDEEHLTSTGIHDVDEGPSVGELHLRKSGFCPVLEDCPVNGVRDFGYGVR